MGPMKRGLLILGRAGRASTCRGDEVDDHVAEFIIDLRLYDTKNKNKNKKLEVLVHRLTGVRRFE